MSFFARCLTWMWFFHEFSCFAGSFCSKDAFGQQAVDYLGSWDPSGVVSSPWTCPGDDVFQAISSGAVFAKHVWYWLHTLRWSGDSTRSPSTDWGVSWLELVVNFRLVTGCDIPIMLEWDHATASAEWLWPKDNRVNMLPFDVLGVARQIKVLSGCICQLERLGGKKLTFGKKGIPQSYWRFNFKTQKNGFLQRPAMLLSRLTAQLAFLTMLAMLHRVFPQTWSFLKRQKFCMFLSGIFLN